MKYCAVNANMFLVVDIRSLYDIHVIDCRHLNFVCS